MLEKAPKLELGNQSKLRNGYSSIHVDFAPQDSAGWEVREAKDSTSLESLPGSAR
uniref:Uncharacterized protein n=1 Tax=Candidatus Kentrum sp. MB TaxID=2138164 RepID=A0A450XKF7_9GAMM|nr:MAG: hypothetical protein BECKMB1821G_GA0114241_101123 [Candidatus Kentron sp. MB]VFK29815.1 MAG: hypothetical protein BECKMB1821I_GA0114274_101213 [Candidatus Kentron sp. MB]VFK74955.1 MAG: hypothetical protein BECKMB1821H_GA0114242_101313 [Candidatus Kentron sp. MB]